MSELTVILNAIEKGNPKAAEELLPLVYEELRKLAASKLASQPPDQTLQPTALVHEAYLRLLGDGSHSWHDRRHFFAGLTFRQAAEVLGLSERTAKRSWAYARAWLFKEIQNL